MTIAERIRQAREAQHYSQETLALAAGISRRTVQNIEAGRPAGPESMRAVMAVLGIVGSTGAVRDDIGLEERLSLIAPASSDAAFKPVFYTFYPGFVGFLAICPVMLSIAVYCLVLQRQTPPLAWWTGGVGGVCIVLMLVGMVIRSRLRSEDEVVGERMRVREQYSLELSMNRERISTIAA